jgi:DNA-binding transcriptional ArsR family regulator
MMDPHQLQRRAHDAADLLKALGNPHRLMILCQLVDGEKAVGELVRQIGLSQSALSQHLARLRRDRLVETRRAAQTIYYTIAAAEARAVLEILHGLYCHGGGGEAGERQHVTVPPPGEADRVSA